VVPDYQTMTERQLGKEIKRLEKQMLDLAKNLQFEKAAQARDQLAVLRGRVFGLDTNGQETAMGRAA
jgi:excinuclease ABC subunit B